MIEAFAQVNWLAILTASIAHFVLGGVWFKVLFRDAYAAALSLSDRLQTKPAPSFLIGPFLCGTVNIVTTALLLRALRIATYADAAGAGIDCGRQLSRRGQHRYQSPLSAAISLLIRRCSDVRCRKTDDQRRSDRHVLNLFSLHRVARRGCFRFGKHRWTPAPPDERELQHCSIPATRMPDRHEGAGRKRSPGNMELYMGHCPCWPRGRVCQTGRAAMDFRSPPSRRRSATRSNAQFRFRSRGACNAQPSAPASRPRDKRRQSCRRPVHFPAPQA